MSPKKKALLIIIDALATRVVEPAIEQGRLPNFAKLVQAGCMRRECISIFPSITPAATSSIATGRYPIDHGVLGAYWYDLAEDRVAYFGDDIWVIINKGLGNYVQEFQVSLNEKRLSAPTVYQSVERAGLTAACLNFLVFKGDVKHQANSPLLLKLLPGVSFANELRGPKICCLGDFITTEVPAGGDKLKAPGGIRRRFGFHDDTTAGYLLDLAERGAMPDFTLAYFPNNDYESHSVGPHKALTVVEKIDEHLGELIAICGGLDSFLEEFAVLISGDHSQSDMHDDEGKIAINLDEVLSDFSLVEAGKTWHEAHDVMACPNMRAAQIYLGQDAKSKLPRVVEQLLASDKVDQVIWMSDIGADEYDPPHIYVATADRGRLEFWQSDDVDAVSDEFGNSWKLNGDLAAVDAQQTASDRLEFGSYPNALERLRNGFVKGPDNLWATARLGYEFCVPETEIHAGGSHGSLHAIDSISPLIAAGIPSDVEIPEKLRSVDLAGICLSVLNIDVEEELSTVGNARVT